MSIVMADLELALTFLDVATTTGDAATRQRNRENAWKAYDTVLQIRPRLIATKEEWKDIDERLGKVKDRLEIESKTGE